MRTRVDTAALLSDSKDARLALFEAIVRVNTLPQREVQSWRARVSEASLSGQDFGGLEATLDASVERTLNGVRSNIESRSGFEVGACVPKQAETLFALLGTPQNDSTFSDHLVNAWQVCWDDILDRDLADGLLLIGPGCMLPYEALLAKLTAFDSGALHDALERVLGAATDPFSIALAFDICTCRFEADPRFVRLGQRAIELLTASGDNAIIRNYAIALPLVLDTLPEQRLLAGQPVFFRRLAAWTWAGFVTRLLSEFEFDASQFLESVEHGPRLRVSILGSLDRRAAPSWRPEWISVEHLRGLLRRRIEQSVARIREHDVSAPKEWQSTLDEVDKRATESGTIVLQMLPGAFDELAHASFKLATYPDENGQAALVASNGRPDDIFLAELQPFIYFTEADAALIDNVRAAAERLKRVASEDRDPEVLSRASVTVSHLAGLHRDPMLSGLAIGIVREITRRTNGNTALFECHLILDAACGHVDDAEYRSFVRGGMEHLAQGPLSRQRASSCVAVLDLACRAEPLLKPYLGRARAGMRLAVRHSAN